MSGQPIDRDDIPAEDAPRTPRQRGDDDRIRVRVRQTEPLVTRKIMRRFIVAWMIVGSVFLLLVLLMIIGATLPTPPTH